MCIRDRPCTDRCRDTGNIIHTGWNIQEACSHDEPEDVYKRQGIYTGKKRNRTITDETASVDHSGVAAVYRRNRMVFLYAAENLSLITHLDVYKRQGQDRGSGRHHMPLKIPPLSDPLHSPVVFLSYTSASFLL